MVLEEIWRQIYLDDETIMRIIAESNGVLEKETRPNTPHHPHRTLRRKKRRRKYYVTMIPNIHKSDRGNFYYRVNLVPQISKQGVILQKRKMCDIRLKSKSLIGAIREIKKRRLRRKHERHTSRKMKARSLKFLSKLVGI